jgi:hypothetical protein
LFNLWPDLVFHAHLSVDNGRNYREFVRVPGGILDVSRPLTDQVYTFDFSALIRAFNAITLVEWLRELPEGINWDWNWDRMAPETGTYTPIVLAARLREYDAAKQTARSYWLSASWLPDDSDLAACLISSRVDHFNYALVKADPLRVIVAML